MYIQYQNDQVFLPFSVNCSKVVMFQIMPALCLHGQGEGDVRGVGGQPNVDRPGQGEGFPKIPKFAPTSFMDDPFMHVNTDFLIQYLRIQKQPSKGQLLRWCSSRGLFGSYAIYYLFGCS